MSEKDRHNDPLAPSNGFLRSDAESGRPPWNQRDSGQEVKKKKRRARLISTVAFVVFLTAVLIFFIVAIARVKSPKVRFSMVTVDNVVTSNSSSTTPSFSMVLVAEMKVKNPNFGHFKFGDSIGTITYDGVDVGQFIVQERKIRSRSSKKIRVMADLDSRGVTNRSSLGSEIGSGFLVLSSQAELRGRVQFVKVIKRKTTAELGCTMRVNLSTRVVQDLKCK